MTVSIQFLGAAETVTGSKYLVTGSKGHVLVDCGMFQGDRAWADHNWDEPNFKMSNIDAVLLTHAHIDHTGMLPRYGKFGLKAPIYGTAPTMDLTKLLLFDTAELQEEEAEYRSREGRSRFPNPEPLYKVADVHPIIDRFESIQLDKFIEVAPGIKARWSLAGHILGATAITLEVDGKRIVFSGDLGRYNVPILRDPEPVEFGEVLLIESTYGDRLHAPDPDHEELKNIITATAKRGGVVVIPAFAVGRTQTLLFCLRELKEKGAIPDIPIIVDSPMARDVTEIYRAYPGYYDSEALGIIKTGAHPFEPSRLGMIRTREQSIALNSIDEPMIIIAGSGMLSGGRILHHLKHRLGDPKNSVVMVGFQPEGGKGSQLLRGARTIRIFGQDIQVRAEIHSLAGLSAHGDQGEMLRWCRESSGRPERVMIVHGEPEISAKFAETLKAQLGWKPYLPRYNEVITL
jgi:metallo-beta-lactamase family protein